MNAWQTLVASAIQGTARRPPSREDLLAELGADVAGLGGDAAGVLLDAAALATAARRAGAPVADGPVVHDPIPPDPRPALPAEALQVDLTFSEAIRLAYRHDLRLPARTIPSVLRTGLRHADLGVELMAAAGPTGVRLAQLNPEWRSLLRYIGPQPTGRDSPVDDQPWRTGTPEERLTWLGELRRASPAEAAETFREVLAGTAETPAFRAQVIGLLTSGDHLGIEDDLLERALDARAADVVRAARAALTQRPRSPYAQRMRQRGLAWARLEPDGTGLRWRAEVPTLPSPADKRDGVDTPTRQLVNELGPSGALLYAVLHLVPLVDWERSGSPGQVLTARSDERFRRAILRALIERINTERDRNWAEALLMLPGWPGDFVQFDRAAGGLAAVAGPQLAERATRVLLRDTNPAQVGLHNAWMEALPFPVSGELAGWLIDALPRLFADRRLRNVATTICRRLGQEQEPVWENRLRVAALHISAPAAAGWVTNAAVLQATRARLHAQIAAVLAETTDGASAPGQTPTDSPDSTMQSGSSSTTDRQHLKGDPS